MKDKIYQPTGRGLAAVDFAGLNLMKCPVRGNYSE